ncbi:MAG: class I SAM-dependent methyltransferase, partial [Candidatus Limnocylindrales bacterium]
MTVESDGAPDQSVDTPAGPDDAPAAAQQVELIEHYDRQYAEGGFGYENQRETWQAWAAEHYVREFDLRPGERLLDVGCGDGFWTGLFAQAGLAVTGTDLSPGGIEIARRAHPGVEFVVGNAEELPFADASF